MERTDRSIFSQGKVHQVVLRKLKPLLTQGLRLVLNVLPEPSKENTVLANSHTLIDLRDKFFTYENNPNRVKELRALWNLIILIYDYDLYYRERADWVLRQLFQGVWRSSDGRREPRRPWWRKDAEVCPICGQDKGGPRVFANCPMEMHKED